MTNSNPEIKDLKFNNQTPDELNKSNFYNDWPVVYVLDNDKEMYIGETYHAGERMKQHLQKEDRRRLKNAHIIGSKDFTKSATLDIESSLIELCSAIEGKRQLQNASNGLVKHNYANKEEFAQDSKFFSHLWKQLQERGLVEGSIENLKNSDLFKLSPYKSLNAEQCTTRDYIIEGIKEAFEKNEPRHFFVNGSAGTGKTILAIYLLKLLATGADYLTEDDDSETLPFIHDLKRITELKPNLKIGYVVSMTSFRKTLNDVIKKIKPLKKLKTKFVIGPNDVAKLHYDILIVDEAHRLKKRKNLSADCGEFDKVNRKLNLPCEKKESDGNQLDWIVKQSDIQIFFYDSGQSIKPTDVDESCFNELKRNGTQFVLSSQMRCMGGMDYIRYINDILNCSVKERKDFSESYDLKLFDKIGDFCDSILKKEEKFGLCRIVSGYGFEWISKKGTKKKPNPRENEEDIVIDNHKFFWNRKSDKWPNSISGKEVIKEVGCIHTIQGYDLNYCGVIFGPEITYRNNKIVIDKSKYYDTKGKAGISDTEILKDYVLNIYSVLMTRGIKGTYAYVCDDELREYLSHYIEKSGE